MEKQIKDITNKQFVLQTSKGVFDEVHYHKMNKMLKLFETKNIFIKRSHVINQVCKHMVENEMLPAICFVLSRKQLELCAKEVTVPLLEFDSKVAYIAKRECEQIIRRLPNYEEYLNLPEYNNLVALIEKGIAIHHAGIMPVLREMVELLFAKGFIKLLFATETFAVGINMPTKTVLFTDINKFDGSEMRTLHSHEFTQMAGRAGRRGIDTVGNVIHLNNLFKNVELASYKIMMKGKPQTLVSKFKISYNLLLNLIDIGDNNFLDFVQRSMIQEDIDRDLEEQWKNISELEKELDILNTTLDSVRTPRDILTRYNECVNQRKTAINKKKKELEREIQNIHDTHKMIESDMKTFVKYDDKWKEHDNKLETFNNTKEYLSSNVDVIINFLEKDGFISRSENAVYNLTTVGYIATHLREIHCLVFAILLNNNSLNTLTTNEIIAIFSCFTNVSVSDDKKSLSPLHTTAPLQNIMGQISSLYDNYQDFEIKNKVSTGFDYSIHYDLMDYVMLWSDCITAEDCKLLLQKLEKEKGVFLGEFVKAILKINNIANEMEKVAESIGNIALLSKLREVPGLTQKFVATNQSLYI